MGIVFTISYRILLVQYIIVFVQKKNNLPGHAKKVFTGVIYDVYHWEQVMFDQSLATYERLVRSDTVVILGITKDKKILMIEEEQPDRPKGLNAVAGKVEPGESIEEGARREFLEETGYTFGDLKLWYTNTPELKIVWNVYTFVAYDCEKTAEPSPEPGEKIEVKLFSFDEFMELILNDTIKSQNLKIRFLEAKLYPKKMQELKQLFRLESKHKLSEKKIRSVLE